MVVGDGICMLSLSVSAAGVREYRTGNKLTHPPPPRIDGFWVALASSTINLTTRRLGDYFPALHAEFTL